MMKVDREAIQFFFLFSFIGIMIMVFAIELILISYVFFFLALFTIFFFRDPKRKIPEQNNALISPADGTIIKIETIKRDNKQYKMISIFMSVFNVHINRAPIDGTIKSIRYNPGKFLPAFNDKASIQNEQTEIIISRGGVEYVMKQIAGLVARRIVVRIKEGEEVSRGQKIGLIRFGSRVDIMFPEDIDIKVQNGDKVKGGISILGVIK